MNIEDFSPDELDPLGCQWIEMQRPHWWQTKEKTSDQKRELSRRGAARVAGERRPFGEKLDFAVRVIRRALEKHQMWALSYSAGTDSTCLSYLFVEYLGLSIPHVMSNTRLEYPQTIRNLARRKEQLAKYGVPVHVVYPDKRPAEVWAEDGIPLFSKQIASKYRQWVATGNDAHLLQVPSYIKPALYRLKEKGIVLTEKCCDELKKKPMDRWDKENNCLGRFTGIRSHESEDRKMAFLQKGSLYQIKKRKMWLAHPLIMWLREDVERFLSQFGVELEKIPTTSGRSGCVNCGFGCHIEQARGETNSLQILHDMNPTMWKKTMVDWKFQEACDVAGIKTTPDTTHCRGLADRE